MFLDAALLEEVHYILQLSGQNKATVYCLSFGQRWRQAWGIAPSVDVLGRLPVMEAKRVLSCLVSP